LLEPGREPAERLNHTESDEKVMITMAWGVSGCHRSNGRPERRKLNGDYDVSQILIAVLDRELYPPDVKLPIHAVNAHPHIVTKCQE
jgi:hypothetical protein